MKGRGGIHECRHIHILFDMSTIVQTMPQIASSNSLTSRKETPCQNYSSYTDTCRNQIRFFHKCMQIWWAHLHSVELRWAKGEVWGGVHVHPMHPPPPGFAPVWTQHMHTWCLIFVPNLHDHMTSLTSSMVLLKSGSPSCNR